MDSGRRLHPPFLRLPRAGPPRCSPRDMGASFAYDAAEKVGARARQGQGRRMAEPDIGLSLQRHPRSLIIRDAEAAHPRRSDARPGIVERRRIDQGGRQTGQLPGVRLGLRRHFGSLSTLGVICTWQSAANRRICPWVSKPGPGLQRPLGGGRRTRAKETLAGFLWRLGSALAGAPHLAIWPGAVRHVQSRKA